MAKFRLKPVVIEAVKASDVIRDASNDWANLPEWFREAYERGGIVITPGEVHLPTPDSTMTALNDDWIIRGVTGHLYACKPDIFAQTYDSA